MKHFPFLCGIAAAMLVCSCSSTDPDAQAAQQRLSVAKELMDKGQFTQALAELDSVDALYPAQIDVRHQVAALRPHAIAHLTEQRIQSADSLIAATQQELASLEDEFTHVDGGGLEGYYLPKGETAAGFTNTTAIQPRVNDSDFRFYIVASNTRGPVGISRLVLTVDGHEVASGAIPAGNDRSSRLEGSEIASFLPEEVDSLGACVYDARGSISAATLEGAKGKVKVTVTPRQAKGIATAWRYGTLKQSLRSALILREKLDRQLQIARDQVANSDPDPDEAMVPGTPLSH